MIGKRISHFRVLDKLGEGGMGVVYRAEDENLGRQVALKVLPPDFVGDEERRARFIREAQTAAAVTHPNIATIHEVGEDDGVTFIAMELVEGDTLDTLSDGTLPTDRTLSIGIEIAAGLARAHESKVVHRDLKPDNIAVGPDGHVKILDFGLAKLYEVQAQTAEGASDQLTMSVGVTRDGRILGTAAYMSPEQARGLPLDSRSDIFSFGVVLYEMVTGRVPFQGHTITDTLSAILRDQQPPIADFNTEVPAELERIIAKCLAKAPGERYQRAEEIGVDLRNLKRISDSQSVPLVSTSGVDLRPPRRWLLPAAVGAGIAITLFALVVLVSALFKGGRSQAIMPVANSLAVMPFDNRQDPGDAERLGQILQELIITDLSGEENLKVFSSQRLFDIQRQLGRGGRATIDSDLATEVARRAGAGTMLSGSVSQLGENWILTTQLVDMTDGTVLKSERINGEDLYVMVDDLTSRIHDNLGMIRAADGTVDVAVGERTSTSLEAYQAFLNGLDRLNDRDFTGAIGEFEEAIEIDPSFGQAYYKLAIARWWARGPESDPKAEGGPSEILDELLSGDIKLADKDRKLAEAFLALVEFRFGDARPLFIEASELDPDDKETWYGLGEAIFHGAETPQSRVDSLDAFEKAVELDPDFRLANVHLIDLYTMKGEARKGIERVKRMIEQDPEETAWYADLARLAILDGDMEEARQTIAEAQEKIGEGEPLFEFMSTVARAYGERGDLEAVEELVNQGLAAAGDNPYVNAGAAQFYLETNQLDRSEKHFDKVLDADSENRQAINGLLRIYERQGRFEEAIELSQDLAEDGHDLGMMRSWIGAAIKSGDEDEIEDALEELEATVNDDDVDANTKRKLLTAARGGYLAIGDYVQAEAYTKRALGIEPDTDDADLMLQLGWSAVTLSELDEAWQWFSRAEERDPSEALLGLARINVIRDDPEEALAYAEKAAKTLTRPDDARALMIQAYIRGGQIDLAAGVLEQLVAQQPTDFRRRELLLDAGRFYLEAGLSDKSLEVLQRADALDATVTEHDPELSRWLAHALVLQGQFNRARTVIESGLRAEPTSIELRAMAAVLQLLEGDAAGAETAALELLEVTPHRFFVQLVAYSLSEQGEYREALAWAERAQEMSPSRAATTLVAWILIKGNIDVDAGVAVALAAQQIPAGYRDKPETFAFVPSPEHSLGLAYLKRGEFEQAEQMLTRAAELRPDRTLIQEDLQKAKARERVASR